MPIWAGVDASLKASRPVAGCRSAFADRLLFGPEGVAAVRALQFHLITSPPASLPNPCGLAVSSNQHRLTAGPTRSGRHLLPQVSKPLLHHPKPTPQHAAQVSLVARAKPRASFQLAHMCRYGRVWRLRASPSNQSGLCIPPSLVCRYVRSTEGFLASAWPRTQGTPPRFGREMRLGNAARHQRPLLASATSPVTRGPH